MTVERDDRKLRGETDVKQDAIRSLERLRMGHCGHQSFTSKQPFGKLLKVFAQYLPTMMSHMWKHRNGAKCFADGEKLSKFA